MAPRGGSQAAVPALTPVKMPKDLSANSLSKHIADLASKIKIAINRNNSTQKLDKDEIRLLSEAIVAASKKVGEVMAPTTVVNDISSTDLLSSIRGIVQDEIKLCAPQTSYANAVAQPPPKSKPLPVSRPAIIVASKDKTEEFGRSRSLASEHQLP